MHTFTFAAVSTENSKYQLTIIDFKYVIFVFIDTLFTLITERFKISLKTSVRAKLKLFSKISQHTNSTVTSAKRLSQLALLCDWLQREKKNKSKIWDLVLTKTKKFLFQTKILLSFCGCVTYEKNNSKIFSKPIAIATQVKVVEAKYSFIHS
jgi:hypothetical protein